MKTLTISNAASKPMSMNALKFAMWLFIISIIMIFASLTSAYIVRKGEGNWLEFELPSLFYISSFAIMISSITMHIAYLKAKQNQLAALKIWMLITSFLGLVFLYLQYLGWNELVSQKVFFVGNPSGSFVYVLSGLHGVHVLAGIIFLLITLRLSYIGRIKSDNMLWMEICATFWHFLDGLWLYLFLFLILNR